MTEQTSDGLQNFINWDVDKWTHRAALLEEAAQVDQDEFFTSPPIQEQHHAIF